MGHNSLSHLFYFKAGLLAHGPLHRDKSHLHSDRGGRGGAHSGFEPIGYAHSLPAGWGAYSLPAASRGEGTLPRVRTHKRQSHYNGHIATHTYYAP